MTDQKVTENENVQADQVAANVLAAAVAVESQVAGDQAKAVVAVADDPVKAAAESQAAAENPAKAVVESPVAAENPAKVALETPSQALNIKPSENQSA